MYTIQLWAGGKPENSGLLLLKLTPHTTLLSSVATSSSSNPLNDPPQPKSEKNPQNSKHVLMEKKKPTNFQVKMKMGFHHFNSSVTSVSSNANKACATAAVLPVSKTTQASRPLHSYHLWGLVAFFFFLLVNTTSSSSKKQQQQKKSRQREEAFPPEKSSQEWENFPFLCPFTVCFRGNLAQVQQDCPLKEGRRKARAKLCSWQIRVFNKE